MSEALSRPTSPSASPRASSSAPRSPPLSLLIEGYRLSPSPRPSPLLLLRDDLPEAGRTTSSVAVVCGGDDAGGPDAERAPPQCDLHTLLCLVGAIEEPMPTVTVPLNAPPEVQAALLQPWSHNMLAGPYRGPVPIPVRETLLQFRTRVLTPEESVVATPREVAWVQHGGTRLQRYRNVWAQRIEAVIKQAREALQAERVTRQASDRASGPTASAHRSVPPRMTPTHSVPPGTEQAGKCHCSRYHSKCKHCTPEAVTAATEENRM